jgi:hypothetical protein
MLIFAPSTIQQCDGASIQNSIHNCIKATSSGDIEYHFTTAMQVERLNKNLIPLTLAKTEVPNGLLMRMTTTLLLHAPAPPNQLP